MHRRSMFERILGGIFGTVLGGLITVCLFTEIEHWAVFLPMILGAVAGLWKGDRALFGIVRLFK